MKIPFCTNFVQIPTFFLVRHTKNLLRNFENKLSVNENTEKTIQFASFYSQKTHKNIRKFFTKLMHHIEIAGNTHYI